MNASALSAYTSLQGCKKQVSMLTNTRPVTPLWLCNSHCGSHCPFKSEAEADLLEGGAGTCNPQYTVWMFTIMNYASVRLALHTHSPP